jgi:hypothetical protein
MQHFSYARGRRLDQCNRQSPQVTAQFRPQILKINLVDKKYCYPKKYLNLFEIVALEKLCELDGNLGALCKCALTKNLHERFLVGSWRIKYLVTTAEKYSNQLNKPSPAMALRSAWASVAASNPGRATSYRIVLA